MNVKKGAIYGQYLRQW